jgi:hypothetical protein
MNAPLSVDLYVYASHEVALWESLWWRLRNRGVDVQFVVEPPGVNRARGTVPDATNGWHDDKYAADIQDLMDPSMFELCCAALERRGLPWLDASRAAADAVVTTAGDGWLQYYGNGLRIRTMYGVGAVTNSYGHGDINDRMDVVLVHGPFSVQAIGTRLPHAKIENVGFPKWAEARRSQMGRDDARRLLGIDVDGDPVIAWLPTWAQNSSLDAFAPALAELATDHRVITKPHHNNLRFEQSRLGALHDSITVVPDLDTLVPLVIASDVVIGDVRSGGVTEALLADRPVVGLVSNGTLDEQNLLTGIDEAVAICEHPSDLRDAVAASSNPSRAQARSTWSRWFFGEASGDDGERAADAIIRHVEEARSQNVGVVALADLDQALATLSEPGDHGTLRAELIEEAWLTWSSDPRLGRVLDDLHDHVEPARLRTCARMVRRSGVDVPCPLLQAAGDLSQAIGLRLAAAAMAASEFSDDEGAAVFLQIAESTAPEDIESCVIAILTHEPSLLPAFVERAGAATGNRSALTTVLGEIGADEAEIDLLLAS